MRTPLVLALLSPPVLLLGLGAVPSFGDVKLIALPERERVELRLEHEGITYIEEERTVPLAAGSNEVIFAWADAGIDRDAVQIRCLSDADGVRILSASFPPDRNAVIWSVHADAAGPATMRIGYVLRGLDKGVEYRADAERDERTLVLRQLVDLHNRTPEDFGASGMTVGFGERLETPIGANETRRILLARYDGVPIRKTWTADLAAHGMLDPAKRQLRVPMHYVLVNDAANGLGRFPLSPGKARVFLADGRGSSAFLGEDWAAFAARDDELRLFIGVARDVVVTRTIERRERRETAGPLADYDIVVKYELENFKDEAITLDLAEALPQLRAEIVGATPRPVEWTLGEEGTLREPDPEKSTADRVLFRVELPPRGADQKAVKRVETLHVRIRNEW